jgi:hypothetical protein
MVLCSPIRHGFSIEVSNYCAQPTENTTNQVARELLNRNRVNIFLLLLCVYTLNIAYIKHTKQFQGVVRKSILLSSSRGLERRENFQNGSLGKT